MKSPEAPEAPCRCSPVARSRRQHDRLRGQVMHVESCCATYHEAPLSLHIPTRQPVLQSRGEVPAGEPPINGHDLTTGGMGLPIPDRDDSLLALPTASWEPLLLLHVDATCVIGLCLRGSDFGESAAPRPADSKPASLSLRTRANASACLRR